MTDEVTAGRTGRTVIDLVADIGEGFGAYQMGDDEALVEFLTSANIACGFHAGDPRIMERTVAMCVERGVGIGAHPSFPDLVGFGRRAVEVTPDELRTDVLYQLGALSAFATAAGTRVVHIAPHGRLANILMTNAEYAAAVVEAVASFDPSLIVLAQEGELTAAADSRGLAVGYLGMADRAYLSDGSLMPRSQPGAVIHDEAAVVERTVGMVTDGVVLATTGEEVPVKCDSILLHGDGPNALAFARRIRERLQDAGIAFASLSEAIADRVPD